MLKLINSPLKLYEKSVSTHRQPLTLTFYYLDVSLCQQEALQCVQELNSTQLLFVFVRNGLESTLERSTIAREHMGLLLHQLIKNGSLPKQQYYKGSVLSLSGRLVHGNKAIWSV